MKRNADGASSAQEQPNKKVYVDDDEDSSDAETDTDSDDSFCGDMSLNDGEFIKSRAADRSPVVTVNCDPAIMKIRKYLHSDSEPENSDPEDSSGDDDLRNVSIVELQNKLKACRIQQKQDKKEIKLLKSHLYRGKRIVTLTDVLSKYATSEQEECKKQYLKIVGEMAGINADYLRMEEADDTVNKEVVVSILKKQLWCSICEEVVMDCAVLPCSHIFCVYCIESVSEKNKQCPLCKEKFTEIINGRSLTTVVDKLFEICEPSTSKARQSIIIDRQALVGDKNIKKKLEF